MHILICTSVASHSVPVCDSLPRCTPGITANAWSPCTHAPHPHTQPCSHNATAVQLRGAISAHKWLRCERVASFGDLAGQHSAAVLRETDCSDTEDGLELLEDSLIGNDVLLGECKRQSDHLRQIFSKCICKDRCAVLSACVSLSSACSSLQPRTEPCSPTLCLFASTTFTSGEFMSSCPSCHAPCKWPACMHHLPHGAAGNMCELMSGLWYFRDGLSSVRLENPSELQCSFGGLSLQAVVRMLGQHCTTLKPYQVAAVGFMACLIQHSARGCILSMDRGLGARTIVRSPPSSPAQVLCM